MRRRARTALAASAAALAASITVGWSAQSGAMTTPEAQQDELCQAYRDFTAAMTNTSPAAQAVRRYRTVRLAAVAETFPYWPQQHAEPIPVAGQRLRTVLALPYASASDAFSAARPVAVSCGWDWRVGQIRAGS